MNETTCDNLDDYLAGELDDRRRTEFEKHSEACPACREELLAQAKLARLLRAATETLEVSPAELTTSIRRGVAVAGSQSRRRITVAATIAAVVVCAAGWGLWNARDAMVVARPQPEQRIVEQPGSEKRQAANHANNERRLEADRETANMVDVAVATSAATVRLDSTSETIAVPIKSENPDVSIFWLYPVVRTAGR
jgi:hypothetical protein